MELLMTRHTVDCGHLYGTITHKSKWVCDTDELILFEVVTQWEDIKCHYLEDGVYTLTPLVKLDENKELIEIRDCLNRQRSAFVKFNRFKYKGIEITDSNGRIEIGKLTQFNNISENARVFPSIYAIIRQKYAEREDVVLRIQTKRITQSEINNYIKKKQ